MQLSRKTQFSRKAAPLLKSYGRGPATLAAPVLLLGLAAHPAQAQSPALTITQISNEYTNPFYSLGYEFRTTAPITVDALGYFTATAGVDALTDSHDVAIYSAGDQTLFTSATVSRSTASYVSGSFVYTAIAPITLGPGDYVVTGASGNDPYVYGGSVTTDPRITYLQSRYNIGNGDEYAPNSSSNTPTLGASFALAAPEPSGVAAFACAALGTAGLILRARRRRA